jgi:hypothetical protein
MKKSKNNEINYEIGILISEVVDYLYEIYKSVNDESLTKDRVAELVILLDIVEQKVRRIKETLSR